MRIERAPSEGYAHTAKRSEKWSYAHRSRNLALRTRTCNPHVLMEGRHAGRAESRVPRGAEPGPVPFFNPHVLVGRFGTQGGAPRAGFRAIRGFRRTPNPHVLMRSGALT